MDLKRIIEAVLFAAPKPLSLGTLVSRLDEYGEDEIRAALAELAEEYRGDGRALEIVEVSGGYQLRTKLPYRDWIRRFVKEKDIPLTRSLMETLSIIAYKQPLTKRDIDAFRGVDSSRVIRQLLDRKLIEIGGRNGDGGKLVFRTTQKFLEVYGLRDLGDLPTLKEIEPFE